MRQGTFQQQSTFQLRTPYNKSPAVTLDDVDLSISTHPFDHGENDEFSSPLDYSTRKWRILSLAASLIDGNDDRTEGVE